MILSDVVKLYEPIASTLSAHAWKSWCKQFESVWGQRDICSIGVGDINKFIASRRKEGKSEGTINSQLVTLKALFKTAKKVGGVDVHYPEDVARVKRSTERVRAYEGNEKQRLQRIMHPLDWDITELSMSTGLRASELWDLRRADVNLTDKFIFVRNGKGRKSRRVPIGKTAMRVLRKMLSSHSSVYVVMPKGHDKYSKRKTSMAIWMRDVWRPCRKAAHIHDFRWHDNRHNFASVMARAGKSIQVIKEVMGHANIAQTLRYAHLNNAALHDAVSCV